MNNILNYLKLGGIFIIIELFISFIISLFNLLGLNSGITTIILLISNIILFFILNLLNARKKEKLGYVEGIKLGLIFIIIMILLKLIVFQSNFNISTLIYYLILLFTSIFGGILGINKKSDE